MRTAEIINTRTQFQIIRVESKFVLLTCQSLKGSSLSSVLCFVQIIYLFASWSLSSCTTILLYINIRSYLLYHVSFRSKSNPVRSWINLHSLKYKYKLSDISIFVWQSYDRLSFSKRKWIHALHGGSSASKSVQSRKLDSQTRCIPTFGILHEHVASQNSGTLIASIEFVSALQSRVM